MHGLCECGCGEATRIAPWDNPSRGHKKGEPLRFVKGHHRRRSVVDTGPDYEVDAATGCWNWLKGKTRDGYGQTRRDGRSVKGHRWYYEGRHGPIPEGLEIDHLCRNRACVNPDHLEPVTKLENAHRGKGTVLSMDNVRFIRVSRSLSDAEMGRMFGVTRGAVRRARVGINWQSVAA